MTETIVRGVLKSAPKGAGVLIDPAKSLRPVHPPVGVPAGMIRELNLAPGAMLEGETERRNGRLELVTLESICGMAPGDWRERTPFKNLTAIDPCERFELGAGGDLSMRMIDLLAPIGRGTRALIVSPPKAGKTMLLEQIARSIQAGAPDARVVALLIDERPEEVTMFRRATGAEVIASSMDQSAAQHVELAETVLAMARAELEAGRDIVLLVDSLTRMGRAFGQEGGGRNERGGGRYNNRRGGAPVLSGGMAAGAMEIPRRFFGMARNVEGGGSVTIVASVLVDTNSRMDEVIFQEFKGTGNCEIVLDRSLAEARIFPALDMVATGTRKEELLHGEADMKKIALMRRALADMPNRRAIPSLIKQMEQHADNRAFLDSLPE